MKATITMISLSAILAGLTLLAQESVRPAAGGGLAERFKQLDLNGDVKLSADEFPGPQFKQIDKNGDGFVTLEEAQSFYSGQRTPQPATERPANAPARPAAPQGKGLAEPAGWLTKPSLEVCLIASSEEQATKFFAEGIGLGARGEPRAGGAGPGMKMLLFSAGSSTVKVRVYQQPPAKLPADIAARNGLRVLTIPVERLDDVVARLKRLGFEVADARQVGETRWALARNADGTAFELVEAKTGAARELEIGLVVPDLVKAREFFTGVYGAKELPEATSRVLPGEKELRFTTGATVFKCWAPKRDRPSDTGQVPDLLGFRYVTHNVRDAQALHDAFTARGVELAQPLSNFQGLASLFMARGPGGAILEFVCRTVAGASGAGVARPAAAQQIPQQLQDMFKRIDRDGDSKLSPSEMPNAEKFKQMDANGDGFVTLEEAARSFGQGGGARRGSPDPAETPDRQVSSESGRPAVGQVARSGDRPQRPITGKEPESHPPTDRAFLDFKFTTDHFAGSQPPDSALAKATEANALVPHNGKLYCAVSYLPESKQLGDVNPKVLVKKSANGPWEVDLEAGPEFMRLGMTQSVTFTTDGRGNKLPKPVSVLIAGTGAWQHQPAGVVVFSRNDSTGKWTKSVLSPNRWNREKTNHETEVRTIWDHVDRVTGVHYVFAGAGTGRIYRGVYDPAQPGLIAWDAKPELDDLVGRFPGPQFKQMDKDNDGFVTWEEARAFFAGRRPARPARNQPAETEARPSAPPASGQLTVVDSVFELCVRDVEACSKFYRDGIGMREVELADASQGALLEWAGSYLRLRKVPGETPAPATGNPMKQMLASNGFRWFSLWFNDPAAIGERLVKAGYPAPMKGGNVSMTRDPDSNVVEIMGVPRSASEETFTWGMAVSDDAPAGPRERAAPAPP